MGQQNSVRWKLLRWVLIWLLLALVVAVWALHWGGELLISSDILPAHVDAAVILQGSTQGEKARVAAAMRLLQQGTANRALLSVPPESYWGDPVPPMAHAYIERNYGAEAASKVDFCIVGPGVNSTEQEAAAVVDCIHTHAWRSIVVVTSNYHTRRAGMIWRKTQRKLDPSLRVWIYAVPDPEFDPHQWWRVRLYAKTWFFEFTKLVWTSLVG